MSQTSVSVFSGRKEARLNSAVFDTISDRTFNAVMCATLLWGFLANAAMVAYLAEPIMRLVAGLNHWVFVLGYFALAAVGIFMTASSTKPIVGFLGYNLLVLPLGVELCILLPFLPAAVVSKALLLTGVVSASMILLGYIRPQFFLGLGRTLFVALLVGIVAQLVAVLLFHYQGSAIDWLFMLIFSGYIGYDIAQSQVYPKTVNNAIQCALDLYIDIINIFFILLRLLSREN